MQRHKGNSMASHAMAVRDLSFSYGRNTVLKNIFLDIEEGKITTILGANGCGKSTLFYLMTKNLLPGNGAVFLRGKSVRELGLREFVRQVSIVQQLNSSSEDIRVEQLVALGRTPYKKLFTTASEEDDRCVEWAMEETGVLSYQERDRQTFRRTETARMDCDGAGAEYRYSVSG